MTRIETPHGPIKCRYDGTAGFHVGDRVRGYGWPRRAKIADVDLISLAEPLHGCISFVFSKSAYVVWNNGFSVNEDFAYLEKEPDE